MISPKAEYLWLPQLNFIIMLKFLSSQDHNYVRKIWIKTRLTLRVSSFGGVAGEVKVSGSSIDFMMVFTISLRLSKH